MFCNYCQNKLNPEDKFCNKCGNAITKKLEISSKSKIVAGLLYIFLASFSIGDLYIENKNKFIAQILRYFYLLFIYVVLAFLKTLHITVKLEPVINIIQLLLSLIAFIIALIILIVYIKNIIKGIKILCSNNPKDADGKIMQ